LGRCLSVKRGNENLKISGAEIQRLTLALADTQALHADAENRFNDTLAKHDALRTELELLRDKQAATERALAENENTLAQFRATAQTLTEKLRRLTAECAEPQPFDPSENSPEPPRATTSTFDPTAAENDSPLARLEAQARAELAKLKTTPSFAKFFKSSK